MVEDEEFLMKYLESVHSFFEADNFQGFILTIKIPFSENNFLKFEVFFKSLQNKKKFYSNDEGIRKYSTKEDLLLDSLIQFKVKNLKFILVHMVKKNLNFRLELTMIRRNICYATMQALLIKNQTQFY